MSPLCKVLVALGLLSVAAHASTLPAVSHEYIEDFSPTLYEASQNTDLLYVTCTQNVTHEANCRFELKTAKGEEKHCNVKLTVPETNYFGMSYTDTTFVKSMFFGRKAVLAWHSWGLGDRNETHRRVSYVDMDDCVPVHLDFPIDAEPLDQQGNPRKPNDHVLVYLDSFDVIVDSKAKCGERHSPCILRYDQEGQRVGGPIDFPSEYYDEGMTAYWLRPSSGGFFTSFERGVKYSLLMNVSHVSDDGTETAILKNHFIEDKSSIKGAFRSNDYGHFSFCHPVKDDWGVPSVRCVQYSASGQQMVNTTVALEKGHLIGISNQIEGGVLLVYYDCAKQLYYCTDLQVRVKVVGRNGRVVQDADLTGVRLPYALAKQGYKLSYFEMKTEHCFYFAYKEPLYQKMKTSLKYFNRCIGKAE